jgi:arginyl-tRNA synthetase
MQTLQHTLASVIRDVFDVDVQPELTRPDEQFGDYATNVAMQLAGRLRRSPRDVAEELVQHMREAMGERVIDIAIAGPGFINITLSDHALGKMAIAAPNSKPDTYKGQVVVTEYSDPNPFKILHAGHLYTSVVGFAIGSLIEAAGGEIHRVNFGGDVGLHVGKTMWAMIQDFGGEYPEKLAEIPVDERATWMGACYVKGTSAY